MRFVKWALPTTLLIRPLAELLASSTLPEASYGGKGLRISPLSRSGEYLGVRASYHLRKRSIIYYLVAEPLRH